MKDNKDKVMGALRKFNGVLNNHGVGYEHTVTPDGKGGFQHFNKFKLGPIGTVSVPREYTYQRPPEPKKAQIEVLKQKSANPIPSVKGVPAPKVRQYGDKGYVPSNGKGVGM